MRDINRITILGNLTSDPELHHTATGHPICSFRVATGDSYTDKAGEVHEKRTFHRVTVLVPALCELCMKHLKKGCRVEVFGQLSIRNYEKDGQQRVSVEIMVRPFRGEINLQDTNSDKELSALASQGYGMPPPAEYEIDFVDRDGGV